MNTTDIKPLSQLSPVTIGLITGLVFLMISTMAMVWKCNRSRLSVEVNIRSLERQLADLNLLKQLHDQIRLKKQTMIETRPLFITPDSLNGRFTLEEFIQQCALDNNLTLEWIEPVPGPGVAGRGGPAVKLISMKGTLDGFRGFLISILLSPYKPKPKVIQIQSGNNALDFFLKIELMQESGDKERLHEKP